MKLFVATNAPADGDDFSWTVAGELVRFPLDTCDCPDCGCERSMCGLSSHRATTSFTVRDLDIDLATFRELLWESLTDEGWVTNGSLEDERWVETWAAEHAEAASGLPVERPLHISFERTARQD
ncbi:MAG: hypothetical protein GEU79_12285 [Acidimicrobiia bacterium]|nr:hypothetical protein [Acidimicrobiia bacterium]